MSNWIYLSYELSADLSNYGGAAGIGIEWVRMMEKGDTSNNSLLQLPAHTGTHIDYPLHFYKEGKSGSNYTAGDLVFSSVGIMDISQSTVNDHLIEPDHLKEILPGDIDFLIIKTGFCEGRSEEKYWKYNWGFAPATASYLKSIFPQLKAIGFDLISLSSYQQREIGREAHKEFLEKNDILIVEDMDLRTISVNTMIRTLIVSPLRFSGADGAPVTIWADLT
jgi:arylformamidase